MKSLTKILTITGALILLPGLQVKHYTLNETYLNKTTDSYNPQEGLPHVEKVDLNQ